MEKTKENATVRYMVAVMAIIVTVAALREAEAIVVPVLLSVFLALLLMPLIRYLRARRIPLGLASFISLFVVVLIMLLIGDILRLSLEGLITQLPKYSSRVDELLAPVMERLAKWGVKQKYIDEIGRTFDPATVANILRTGMVTFIGLATNLVLIFFITLFLLMESHRFKEKVIEAYGERSSIPKSIAKIGKDIQRYIILKTTISVITGSVVYLFLFGMGLDFAMLWGFIAFCLNFVPNVGSVVATIPPVLLSTLQFSDSPWTTVIILVGLTAIQVFIGNFLDPHIMGKGLHVSTLVVFLSMVFFGWLWGFIGMFLAIPLVVSLRVIISHQKGLRPLSIMVEG